jgi:hypothetical protein
LGRGFILIIPDEDEEIDFEMVVTREKKGTENTREIVIVNE